MSWPRSTAPAPRAIGYVSNPEFLREGAAVDDVLHPDRIVIGAYSERYGDEVQQLFAGIDTTVVRTSVATAEMIKYASNAFLATKISFINEIANVCEAVGADVRAVADGMGLDHRIGPHFLQAGIGYGGSCFPKDVQALKQLAGNSGYHFQLLNAVIEVNHLQKRRVVGKLQERLGRLRGKHVALLGLTFKPHTDDLREAASIVLAARLRAEGARVSAYDPMVAPGSQADLFPGVEIATQRPRSPGRRRRGHPGHRVARVRRARLVRGPRTHARPPRDRRPQRARRRASSPPPASRTTASAPATRRPRPSTRSLPTKPGRARPVSGGSSCAQAVVLVGGEGTRLRPITSLVPKPVVPLVGRPFVGYILENLARHGVERAVFSAGYLADALEDAIGDGAQLRPDGALRGRRPAAGHRRRHQERARPSSTTAACSPSTATC